MRTSSLLLLTVLIVAATVPAMALSLANSDGDGIFVSSIALDSAGTAPQTDVDIFISETPQTPPIDIPGVNDATDQAIPTDSADLLIVDQSLSEMLYFLSDFNDPLNEPLISGQLLSKNGNTFGPLDEGTLVPEPAGLSLIGMALLALSRKRK